MATKKIMSFSKRLADFKGSMLEQSGKSQPRIILVMMADTSDKTLKVACEKDVKIIRNTFKAICKHIDYDLSSIEITGKDFGFGNLLDAKDAIVLHHADDVILFYYSGHGFSYKKDSRRKYPQLDLRPNSRLKKYNKMDMINAYSMNLVSILDMFRLQGCRINIAIGDCCNTNVPVERPSGSDAVMNIVSKLMPDKSKTLTKKLLIDSDNEVAILISSSQHGQPAVSDPAIGSIFTHEFAKALTTTVSKQPEGSRYLPWLGLLKRTANKAFKESKGYDIGGGKAGKQKAVFEIFVEKEKL